METAVDISEVSGVGPWVTGGHPEPAGEVA